MDIFKDTMSEMTYEQIEKLVEENMKDIMFWIRRFIMIYGIIMICTFFMCLFLIRPQNCRWYLSLEESLFLHCLEWQRCSSIIQKKS